MARHGLVTGTLVAEAQAAAIAAAAPLLHDPEYRRMPPPSGPGPPPCPGVLPRPDEFRPSPAQHVTDGKRKGGATQPRQVYERPEDVRLLSLVGR